MTDLEVYEAFPREANPPWCWACGRGETESPDWWHAPWFMQRHHIVNKPRMKDRRAVILLCPACHGRIHGDIYRDADSTPSMLRSPWGGALTLPAQLWLKRTHDPDYYDRKFLAALHIGRLPPAREPFREYRSDYCKRRG